jgi:hypothetical protein
MIQDTAPSDQSSATEPPLAATVQPVSATSVSTSLQRRPSPLPAKIDDWQRKNKSSLTLNDYVEQIHRSLWDDDPSYRAYLEAVWDSDAVEGSLAIDNMMAAMKIRDKAPEFDGNPVGSKKLDTIVRSMNVVLRRYENSRKERRETVQGVQVPYNE